jgi:hypothetical protein
MSAISDIDICYSNIGDKYIGLKIVIPILEVFRYRHQCPFRYLTLKKIISPTGLEHTTLLNEGKRYTTQLRCFFPIWRMSDSAYRIKPYSNIRHNVGLCSLSPISEVPISGLVRYRAQSDIADHGYRTKCPPVSKTYKSISHRSISYRQRCRRSIRH